MGDPRILPDMGVKVTFLRDDGSADVSAAGSVTLVPKAAIKADGNQSYAFVVPTTGIADRRALRVGGTDGDRIEVVAGLDAGERVSPPPELAAGTRVVTR